MDIFYANEKYSHQNTYKLISKDSAANTRAKILWYPSTTCVHKLNLKGLCLVLSDWRVKRIVYWKVFAIPFTFCC